MGVPTPRTMLLGILIVTAIYILVSAVFMYLVPLWECSIRGNLRSPSWRGFVRVVGAKALAAIVAACVLSSMAAVTMSDPWVYYAMAQDDLFFVPVGRIHPRFGTRTNAIVTQGLVASLLVLLGSVRKSFLISSLPPCCLWPWREPVYFLRAVEKILRPAS